MCYIIMACTIPTATSNKWNRGIDETGQTGTTIHPTGLSFVYWGTDTWKNWFFLAAQYRSKLWINDIYTCIRTFVQFGVTRPSQKKVIRVQSWDFCIFAGDFGTRSLCTHVTVVRIYNGFVENLAYLGHFDPEFRVLSKILRLVEGGGCSRLWSLKQYLLWSG